MLGKDFKHLLKPPKNYEIEVVGAGETILPPNLYAEDSVCLCRDVKAIRLFKTKAGEGNSDKDEINAESDILLTGRAKHEGDLSCPKICMLWLLLS